MKTNFNFQLRFMNMFVALTTFLCLAFLNSCNDDEPTKEDTPELITKATLTFIPAAGGNAIRATATDPDGEGAQNISIDGPINLSANASYVLTVTLINELADRGDPEYNITEEVQKEGNEHMFFFSWTNNVFSDPTGNGNMDNRADNMHYSDEDDNGQPIGLVTSWTTAAASSGKFRLVLKHQPELKTATSTSSTGETDLDIEFNINIQ
jgi:hypothetical protein